MDQKVQLDWLSQSVAAITIKIEKSFEDLVASIEAYNPQSSKYGKEIEKTQIQDQRNDDIEDYTANMDVNHLYSSDIHEQIAGGVDQQQAGKQNKHNSNFNENQIQQIIQIYGSRTQKSPTKTPQSNRAKAKSAAKSQFSPNSNQSKLLQMEKQKLKIEEHLRKLNQEMKIMKKQQIQIKVNKKPKDIFKDVQAAQNAHKMLMKIQKQRREMQQKKNREQIKLLQQIEKETTQKQIKRRQEIQRIKRQKREAIAQKLQAKKRQKQQKMAIEKESNLLIHQLKKSQIMMAKNNSTNALVEKKKSLYMKRNISDKGQQINSRSVITDELKHPKIPKSKSKINDHNESDQKFPKPIVHYPKGKFLQILQQEDKKKKEQDKQKEQAKKQALQKRIKYGQLINNLFVPTKSRNSSNIVQSRIKPPTPDAPMNQYTRSSLPRRTQEQVYKKSTKSKQLLKRANIRQNDKSEIDSEQNEEKEKRQKQKQFRLKQYRKQTELRLKKATQKQQQIVQTSRNVPKVSRYSNYLKQLPKHKVPEHNWKKILDNQKLTKQQKYLQLLSQVNHMQNKAKMNQKFHKGDDQTMNLIIDSIQAKLAMLDQL